MKKIRKITCYIISFGFTIGAFHLLETDGPLWAFLLCCLASIVVFMLRNPWDDEAKGIISSEFEDIEGSPYAVSSISEETFLMVKNMVKKLKGNEYDTAIGFMPIQINRLYDGGSVHTFRLGFQLPKLSEPSLRWAEGIEAKCKKLMKRGALGEEFYNGFLAEIESSREKRLQLSL